LIFGRHHEIFNYSKFIQVKQIQDGIIEIHYVSDISEVEAANYFDTENLNFDIKFVKKIKATRTLSGKISLLIK
jgi:phenylacetate-CoA ligase